MCGGSGGGRGVGIREGLEGWGGQVGGKQKCKITNLSHHRIHVSNI